MKKIIFSMMTLVLVIGLLGSGAFAYFSDTETSEDNSFAAGTLNLAVEGQDGSDVTTHFDIDDVYPGDGGTIEYALENTGSLAGYLSLTAIVTDDEGPTVEAENGYTGVLSDAIDLEITVDSTTIFTGTLAELETLGTDEAAIGASSSATVTISWSIDGPTVGNEIQSDTVDVDLTFILNQIEDQP